MHSETEARLGRIEREIADIKATLARMMPMLVRLIEIQTGILQRQPEQQT